MMKYLSNLIEIKIKRIQLRYSVWKVKRLKRQAVRLELKILYEHMMCLCIDTTKPDISADDVCTLGKDIAEVYTKIDALKESYIINDAAEYYTIKMNEKNKKEENKQNE